MTKTTTSLWYSVWVVSLVMALSILAVMMVNLPTPAHAKQIDDTTNLRSSHAFLCARNGHSGALSGAIYCDGIVVILAPTGWIPMRSI